MPQETTTQANDERQVVHETPTDLNRGGVAEITAELRQLLADAFALYLKTRCGQEVIELGMEPRSVGTRRRSGPTIGQVRSWRFGKEVTILWNGSLQSSKKCRSTAKSTRTLTQRSELWNCFFAQKGAFSRPITDCGSQR